MTRERLLYALPLTKTGSPDNAKTYIRIPLTDGNDDVLLRFILEPGSDPCGVTYCPTLHTTYPIDGTFDRSKFHALPFSPDSHSPVQARYICDIRLLNPGAYEYHVTYRRENALHHSQTGYFVVEPRLYVGSKLLPLDALMIQSVVPKWLGPVSKWKPHIELVKATGYNMIHFAPMQQRGSSDSPYSIRDQLLFSDDLFDHPDLSRQERVEIVRQVVTDLYENQNILCLSDIVWNHTSHDSPLLKYHPDAGYNLHNSPHLVPAYELDTALLELSGCLEEKLLPSKITSDQDVNAIVKHIRTILFPDLRLWEYKVVNVEAAVSALRQFLESDDRKIHTYDGEDAVHHAIDKQASLLARYALTKGHPGTRFNVSVDVPRAASFMLALAGEKVPTTGTKQQQQQQQHLLATFKQLLDQYNVAPYAEYGEDVKVALENIASRIRFRFLDANGPRLSRVSLESPLLESYFTRLDPNTNYPAGSMQLANNGWIWAADPTQDFAGPASSAYLRRQVICWGDCVKLRYGNSPKDNPWLWDHMKIYTEQIASIFHGIRIDNCHSTPIHVAEYLLDAARRIRPDLYVLAELFTGSPQLDNLFVSKLGIHALLREAMQAWDPHELSRLAHRHGGKPFGSMDEQLNWKRTQLKDGTTALMIPVENGSMPRALFMDCTHDNETPYQKRTAEDSLPNAAIVAFSDCAVGSVKGYDELYPYLLDVVDEKRLYTPFIDTSAGIIQMKGLLQKLHMEMSMQGYTEVHVHHEDDYVIVHRQHPVTHNGYLLIARTAFQSNHSDRPWPVRLHMTRLEYIAGATLKVDASRNPCETKYLVGLPSRTVNLPEPSIEHLPGEEQGTWYAQINVDEGLKPGSVYIFKTSLKHDGDPDDLLTNWSCRIVENLDLLDCNVVLYRCEGEEMDAIPGNGAYYIPNFGKMQYCGLEGFMAVLRPIIRDNDLGHPFCDNLRQGSWAMDYIAGRLSRYLPQYPHLKPLIAWLTERFDIVKRSPKFLVPKYFSMVIHTAYNGVRAHAIAQMAPFVAQGDIFVQSLALCGVQMQGIAPSTGLHPTQVTACLAAGLPHFTHGCMRTWGRDVFISLRGLLMVTGRFDEAKEHIIRFASTLRHGLIPNLLDAGRNPRYNARDAVWWFMQAIQDYYHMAPDGKDILSARVQRRFPPNNDYVPVEQAFQWECSLAELIQEIMQNHAQGIHFREHNAGPAIDSQMTDAGFSIDIYLDPDTGVLVGGNEWNCGTWMDKMGESVRAGNKGHPGTSRDGAPIEITGLVKSALRWILQLIKCGEFKWTGVQVDGSTLTFQEWNDRLEQSFEHIYYIPKDPAQDDKYAVDPHIINRRGIYKDVYKATHPYTEYQFRPNLCVAMVVAPELFDPAHAKECLELMNVVLLGPLGMRTLDPSDLRYRPYYNNADDSDDYDVAKGRNYHQGPEWVWPVGYYLRAEYQMKALTPEGIAKILYAHRREIMQNPWAGLPELTNKDGETCWDSCFSQAWSASCILDILYDLK